MHQHRATADRTSEAEQWPAADATGPRQHPAAVDQYVNCTPVVSSPSNFLKRTDVLGVLNGGRLL